MNLYPDIGELGWSLYLYGYLNYLWESNKIESVVITHSDRKPMFKNIYGCHVIGLPDDFSELYGSKHQDGFGLYGVSGQELTDYFKKNSFDPRLYQIAPEFRFGCHRFFDGKMKFKPFKYEPYTYSPRRNILIFPRYRASEQHSFRNCTRGFYISLIKRLCLIYPDHNIECVGKSTGAYSFGSEISCHNFIDFVGSHSIEDLIDSCAKADVAIGGTSAPPKISMLQGVPTFVLGHEKQRFTVDDNWMGTKCGFYEFGKDEYQSFNQNEAIESVLKFVKEVI